MIEVRDLCKSYDGRAVIEDLTLTIPDGERAAITAPSGCGKTTLLRLIAGLEKPDRGSVSATGGISYIFQEPRLFPDFTALQNVAAVLRGKDAKERALAELRRVGLGRDADKYPDELSGGMAQRAALARALALDRPILLMDEPFKGLDAEAKKELYDVVLDAARGKTLLLVTHDEAEGALLCERLLRFTAGMKLL